METSIRLVIFDWAGTVIDFGCCGPSGAFVQVFAEKGVELSLKEARGPMGLHKKDHIRTLLRQEAIEARWRHAQLRPWTEDDVELLYQLVTPMQIEAAKKYRMLIPEVLDCVQELRKRNLQIAASTGYFQAAADVCYAAGREQGFVPDFTICADQVSAGRPAPWMIYRCMEALNVYPPTAVVKIGDTLVDIEDGVNAGVWSIGVVDSSNEMGLSLDEFRSLSDEEKERRREPIREAFFEAGADGVVDTLRELPSVIEDLNQILLEDE